MSADPGRTTARRRTGERTRRPGPVVRSQLLAAALEMFAERGYAGASTSDIARRANVTEALLFRHFGNKAGLFEAAVLEPFEQFVDAYTAKWAGHRMGEKPLEDLVRDFVEVIYGFFDTNRAVVDALLSSQAHLAAVAVRLDEQFERLQQITVGATREFGLPAGHSDVATRLSFGLIMSATVHAGLLFPAENTIARDDLIGELSDFLLYGVRVPDGRRT